MSCPSTPRWAFSLRQLMAAVAGVAFLVGGFAWLARNWWASKAFQCGLYFYPRFAWVAGATTLFAIFIAVADRRVWRVRSFWLLLPIAVPVALLAFGIAFRHDSADGAGASTIDQHRLIVDWFPWLHVPIGIILLGCFRSVSNWLMIGCISIAAAWLSFGSQIMSWMSVTDTWL